MCAYQKCKDKMQDEYRKFREFTAKAKKVQTSALVENPEGSYLIAFRHADDIMNRFADFAKQIRDIIPSIAYNAQNAHTTITVCQEQKLKDFRFDEQTFDHLCKAVEMVQRDLWQAVRIELNEWLFNETTVIVAGQPNDIFWAVAEVVMGEEQKHLDLQHLPGPWAAHITAARFLNMADEDSAQALRDLLKNAPSLGTSTPVAIDVGWGECSRNGFCFNALCHFA